MITVSFVVIFVFLPVAVWLWMRRRTRRLHATIAETMESCNCEMAKERAKIVGETVDATIAMIDSRAPKDEEPITEEQPIIDPPREAKFTVPTLAALLLFLIGFQIGGEAREFATTRPQRVRCDTIITAQEPIDAKLAELRAKPTLALVAWFDRAVVVDSRRDEVVEALEKSAKSPDKFVAREAGKALARWKGKF